MSEVSTWNPVDESNTAAPPNGWPEFMQPSEVNNCARMMMGAIRRWYDTATAGIANALPLSGGTLTGALQAPQLSSTGNINASGNISAGNQINAVTLLVTSSETVNGNLAVGNSVNVANQTTTHTLLVTGNETVNGDVEMDGNLTVANQITAHALLVTTNETINGDLAVSGTVSATNVNCGNNITAFKYQMSGSDFAERTTDGAGTANVIFDGAGGIAFSAYGPGGSYYRADNAHFFTNRAATLNVCRFQTTDGNCINASGLWNVVSDVSIKDDIAPYPAGLEAALQLEPVSFRYSDDAPFGAGELHYGLVAQDVEPILPEMCRRAEIDDHDYLTIAPGHLVFVLLNSVKELAAQNRELEARLRNLEHTEG